jgi:hypothetical protein
MEALRAATVEEIAQTPGMTLPSAEAVVRWFAEQGRK